ncbi:hypothetical protein [Yersinia intermedia]|jgi:hypothetical protein|uniref:Lipoprotein n=1 Tax=Yersinia intermedia TaxID=631 RepID=A0A209A4B8_YERIN|nr:hypothetical protein [Yersinia intermedia]MCB5315612.1 hypothetical protein [Yersinia intermedia]MCB5320870.1 hypothetical protein [Yersinia intermedia]MCB5329399.1 hypothetical protein [Yersinia intermedia]OVZ87647.1 hypothetical protein CBW57_08700 [Yersinia intermedia]UNK25294.1 hypothetical protein MNQ97_10175 [Yersinia intermedia]
MIQKRIVLCLSLASFLSTPVWAINKEYRQKLEQSGCTQVSEAQGCDINKTKAENTRAGFVNNDNSKASTASPYTGQWQAMSDSGTTVANISIDAYDKVTINGKSIKAKKLDGGLQFKQGKIIYTIQGDRRLEGEDVWRDTDAGTQGKILKR